MNIINQELVVFPCTFKQKEKESSEVTWQGDLFSLPNPSIIYRVVLCLMLLLSLTICYRNNLNGDWNVFKSYAILLT